MPYRQIPFAEGEYFHVYNRGANKQAIFVDDEDRNRFIKLLYLCNSEKNIHFRDDIVDKKIDAWDFERGKTIVSLGAWVLMPNHFHLYITTKLLLPEDGLRGESRITEFMRKVCTSYSKYFNKKYDRTGTLFESRFKSTHVTDDQYAKYLFSYIHLNPIKLIEPKWKEEGIQNISRCKNFLDSYAWSSYLDHRKAFRNENLVLDMQDFPKYFSAPKVLEKEIFEWLSFREGF